MYRDSSGRNLYLYLAQQYATALFSRSNNYNLLDIDACGATDVIVELADRNLDYILKYPAVCPAPVRDDAALIGALPIAAEVSVTADPSVAGYSEITGVLPDGLAADSPVYLRIGDTVYEAMNFLLGFLLIVVFFSQLPSYTTPTITSFMDGCPYESASGLQQGDEFWKIDGHRIYTSSDVSMYLERNTSDYKDIIVIRDGQKVELSHFYLALRDYVDPDTGETVQKYGFYFGVKESGFGAQMKYSWYCSLDFVREVWMGLSDLFTGTVSIKQMTGPVGIVDIIAQVGNESPSIYDAFLNIAYLTAFIAINLAVVNLLPLPALDGGRVFFLLVTWVVEHVIRRKINPKYEGYINTAGLLLLMALMVYVMYNDIARIITKS